MNELQSAEFDILREFVEICEKLDLTYYLVCGSCLGAVKYGGFIPWDDDIDVALKRPDYELFIQKAPGLLSSNLFLQNYKTEKHVPFLYTKLRDSRTTFIEKASERLDINHGVYIDIFPLDGYPKKHIERFERKRRMYSLQTLCAYENKVKFTTGCFLVFERLLGFHKRTAEINRKLEKLLVSNPVDSSELWCNFGNWQGKLEYAPREQYGKGTAALFEGLQVRIPERYDAYLTQKYGDWRADLPEKEQKPHHQCMVCDLKRSYTEYINL